MKPSGLGLYFVGIFLIINLVSLWILGRSDFQSILESGLLIYIFLLIFPFHPSWRIYWHEVIHNVFETSFNVYQFAYDVCFFLGNLCLPFHSLLVQIKVCHLVILIFFFFVIPVSLISALILTSIFLLWLWDVVYIFLLVCKDQSLCYWFIFFFINTGL